MADIKSVDRQTLSEQVYEMLKKAIMDGEFKPGEKLSEIAIGKQMNVSATPVREAFRRLAANGFISLEPYRGAVVRKFSINQVIEAYQCREALECLACRLAAANIDDKGITKMRSFLANTQTNDSETYLALVSTKIHNIIISYANNTKLKNLLDQLNEIVLHDRNVSAHSKERCQQIKNEHRMIIEALAEKDGESAAAAMSIHVKNGLDFIIKEYENNESGGDEIMKKEDIIL